jgi:hypothetical protein
MANLINPKIQLQLFGTADFEINDLDIDIDITKDLDEEPNEAVVTIYNLNKTVREQLLDANAKDLPIKILFTPFGSENLQTAFVGEVEKVTSKPTRPGFATHLECSSQKWQHRALYIDKKTYAAGTAINTIVDDFVKAINIPSEIDEIPTTGILLAQSFSGPAFPLLQRFVFDFGMFCYIIDGLLKITNVYEPVNPITVEITENILLESPQPAERSDAIDVELHTVTETVNLDPLRKLSRRQKKAIEKKGIGKNDYVEVQAIDTVISGVTCDLLALPTINPDNFVDFGDGKIYRTHEVNHFGNNYSGGITTRLGADAFDGAVPPTGGAF